MAIAGVVAPAAEVVNPSTLAATGWQTAVAGTGAVAFETGPTPAPLGTGSVEFRASDGSSAAELVNTGYDGLFLDQIAGLVYQTFVELNGGNAEAVSLVLIVDSDETPGPDDRLIFEPRHQLDYTFPPQPVTLNVWQEWDARSGLWWSQTEAMSAEPATILKTIDDFVNSGRPFRIVSVRLVAPGGAFIGNADALAIVKNDGGQVTAVYDFEPDTVPPPLDADGDGILDADDHCVNSDLRPFVDADGAKPGETGIANSVDANGCSIQDLVNGIAAEARNHGNYVSGIAHLAKALQAADTIIKKQAQELKRAADKSSIGKK